MNFSTLLWILLLSLEQFHPVLSTRGPKINLSHQKGGDIRTQPNGRRKYKALYQDDDRKWQLRENSNYIVPYTITGNFNKKGREVIKEAMERIHKSTCIRFRERRDEWYYLNITDGTDGCKTYVGRGTPNTMELEDSPKGSCMYTSTVLHELFHALGLFHEHQRADRDEYITFIEGNLVAPDLKNQFTELTGRDAATYETSYDYKSIMHYEKTAFAQPDKVTMVTKDPHFQDMIGKQEDASRSDYEKICKMYKCQSCSYGCHDAEKWKCNSMALDRTLDCNEHTEICCGTCEALAERGMDNLRHAPKWPNLTLSDHRCNDQIAHEDCEQLVLRRGLNCGNAEQSALCCSTCTAYYRNHKKMDYFLRKLRRLRVKYSNQPFCEDSDQWRCEVHLVYNKMDCSKATGEASNCCVTCASYREYMDSTDTLV